ncbi:hypothetical protein [Thalassobacterium maritimum]|uniref:hypothetical protein n=1 Tax=Thalassobacterium maritimum TaxID=3041265 RepID=UPI00281272AA|nr:hypothetical protein [Coraliomargarita sp. SDUM461003]
MLSLTAFVRVETRLASDSLSQLEAKQNAMLGLNIALGALQQHTGPDQRVTGRADVSLPASVNLLSGEDGATVQTKLDTYWQAQRNRQWTGVWRNTNTSAYDPENPKGYNAQPSLLSWLVSGNEGAIDYNPTDQVTGLNATSRPSDTILGSGGQRYALLVTPDGNATGGGEAIDRSVTAPIMEIDLGVSGHGSYAWWVGDEGVKARANLVDPYAESALPSDQLRRAASAQRVAVEAMTTDGSDGLAPFYTPNDPALADIFSLRDFAFLNNDSAYMDELDSRFHDLTLSSWGVLADVKHGGLKRDLSYILGQADVASLQSAAAAAYEVNAADGYFVIEPTASSNRFLNPLTTAYAEVPSDTGYGDSRQQYSVAPGIMAYTPTWEMLGSYHNAGNLSTDTPVGVYTNTGAVIPRLQSPTQSGIGPMVSQAKVFYNLNVGSTVQLQIIPQVVLVNPYSVPLAPAQYTVLFTDSQTAYVRFGTPANVDDPQVAEFSNTNQVSLAGAGLGSAQMILQSDGMAPGEAQIFSLQVSGDLIPSGANAQAAFQATMVNDYDPSAYLVYDTGVTIPSGTTHAALFFSKAHILTELFLDYDPAEKATVGDRRLVHSVSPHYPSTGDDSSNVFLVYPVDSGLRVGGGSYFRLEDLSQGTFQRAYFLQQNYRMSMITGFHGFTSGTHLKEWARGYVKTGFPGNEKYIGANLLRPSGSLTNVRWGPVNSGVSSYDTAPPPGIGSDLGFTNLLYEYPEPGIGLSSLGQLQHFNTMAYVDRINWQGYSSMKALYGANVQNATTVQAWQGNYTLSNSYPNPGVARDQVFGAGYSGYHYDGSYLWNDALWDRFYFSTYPALGDFDFENDQLVNHRYQPFRSQAEVPHDDETKFRGDGNPSRSENSRMAAANLMSKGAFNINSTSVEAWKAWFASLSGVPIGDEADSADLTAPFARSLQRIGESNAAATANNENAWAGFRNLTAAEIQDLSEEMVRQVVLRGPFLSMADFVNRRLVSSGNDTYGLGLKGALQSALDVAVNDGRVDTIFDKPTLDDANIMEDSAYKLDSFISGFPGHVLQGDVLSRIGQYLSARSDTFRIRTYGDVLDPVSSSVKSRAWCEALVQRLPDYVRPPSEGGDAAVDPALHADNLSFGRKYQIISIRWLTEDEL